MADNIEPISHLEKVITGNAEPISHLEQVIALYGSGSGGGSGTGTTNYNGLTNKPSINGVDLVGNKTLADLGIDLSKYTTTDKAVTSIELVDAIPTGSTGTTTEKCLRLTFADGTTVVDVSVNDLAGGSSYDDTKVKKDIADLKSDKQDKTDNSLDTTDKTVVGAINEVNGNQLDTVGFSADYKNIILNRKSGLNPYVIPIASIIHNAKIIELNDVDSTNIGDGKTLVYDGATKKHKYVDSTGTDELVKMDSTTDAKHLSELIDKSTIVNDNGTLKVKKLDGQNVTIAEINHLKGLTMNVMDLVNAFANGGVKVLNTPVATHADLSKLDRSTFLDGISYIVYVLADETHSGAKTTYLCDKKSSTFFGNADSQRNFITDPIDLANEVTGKLGTSNIDVDALWKLLTINDTYKTLTTKDEAFGTHGAKALYDELVAEIGKKANSSDLTSHTGDTDIHITTSERTAWNNKANATDLTTHTSDTNIHITSAERTLWNDGVRRTAFVGSNDKNSNGWYKVAEQTCSGYGNTNITFMVTSTFGNYHSGILQLQIRSDGSSISCGSLKWLTRVGFNINHYVVAINGMTWALHAYQPSTQYGRIAFEILSMSSGGAKDMTWTLNFEDNNTKETTTPVAAAISSDGSKVNAMDITTTINSSSTDTQVPNAKAVYDNTITTGLLLKNSDYNIDTIENYATTHINVNSGCTGTYPAEFVWGTFLQLPAQNFRTQILISKEGMYYRIMNNGTWQSWYKVNATEVTKTTTYPKETP